MPFLEKVCTHVKPVYLPNITTYPHTATPLYNARHEHAR